MLTVRQGVLHHATETEGFPINMSTALCLQWPAASVSGRFLSHPTPLASNNYESGENSIRIYSLSRQDYATCHTEKRTCRQGLGKLYKTRPEHAPVPKHGPPEVESTFSSDYDDYIDESGMVYDAHGA